MSVETEEARLWQIETRAVGAGIASGFVAGVPMGLLLQFGTDLLPVLGTFLGAPSAVLGWLVHLFVAVAYGVVFATFLSHPAVQTFIPEFGPTEYVLSGIVYATFVVAISIGILPLAFQLPWVETAGGVQAAGVPGPGFAGLVPSGVFALGHLVYGAVLGAIYATFHEPPE